MTAVIEARGLAKSFGAKRALDGVSFSVQPGRIVGLIGPNGAGKTTALKAILGLTPFSGELSVLGLDPRTQRDRLMREVCFMADVAVLPRWLRVRNALDYCQGVHPRFDRSIAAAFLEKTDIQMDSRVRELSKGMVTQLHLALIMAIDARLLVLDEPTAHLDVRTEFDVFGRLAAQRGDATVVLISHRLSTVRRADRIVLVSGGRIAEDGSHDELMARGGEYAAMFTIQADRFRRGYDDRIDEEEGDIA